MRFLSIPMRNRSFAIALPAPRKMIPLLALSCAVVFVVYLALVAATVYFASAQTNLALSIRDSESRIGNLETTYYEAIGKISSADVSALGYEAPSKAQYVSAAGQPTVTFADGATRTR